MNSYKFLKIATAAGIVCHLMFACSQDDQLIIEGGSFYFLKNNK